MILDKSELRLNFKIRFKIKLCLIEPSTAGFITRFSSEGTSIKSGDAT